MSWYLTCNYPLFTVSPARCRKLPKALKEWQAYEELRKTIDDFNETCPLLEMMAHKAMMNRHWERIAVITGHTFDVDSDNFLLRNLMEAPLLQFKEDIEVRSPVMLQVTDLVKRKWCKKPEKWNPGNSLKCSTYFLFCCLCRMGLSSQ